jgi:UDP-GlcNAc:undecaprenyl-phosphate GlcNAc-1-phosphate transferase
MGDSGAMLLGFSLAAVSVEGLLKTAATVALFFPLLVLAVPILDTGFVVARRLKYRMPITTPDKTHLHHRFVDIGFSQPRAVAYIYFWVATLAAAALGTRYIPFREGGRVRLHGLPARDRQAGEPAHPAPAPRGGRAGATHRVATIWAQDRGGSA